jgi:tol-pal system protein YbgF
MKSRGLLVLAGGASVLLCAGCVMPDQLSQMQKDLADVRQELRQVQRDQAEVLQKLTEVESGASREEEAISRADLADLNVSLQQVSRDLAISDERMNDLDRRVDLLTDEVQRDRDQIRQGPIVTPVPLPGNDAGPSAGGARPGEDPAGALPDREALYNTAYTDFNKGNYALAVSGFEEYIEMFPESALADNAAYWVGECYFSQGNFEEAIRAFDRMLERYPDSDKAAAGNLKKALAYLEQNQISLSIVQLRHVISAYGGSDEAKIARDKLTSLGASL